MSACYSINILINLKNDLSETDVCLLKYLINGAGPQPTVLPSHTYFSNRLTSQILNLYTYYFAEGSRIWFRNPSGANQNGIINLILPSIKDPMQWEFLELIDWIASMSLDNGFIGAMADDFPEQLVTFLYIFDGQLFFGNGPAFKVIAFSSAEERYVNNKPNEI
jgi:hypothetical protein